MLTKNIDVLQEIPASNEALEKDEAAVLEWMQLETFEESRFLSEVDEVRVNETSEIMAEVFDVDTLADWPEMSLEEKTEKLNEYFVKAGENLGIDTKGVIVEEMQAEQPGMILFGYNSGDGYIHLNEAVVDEPSVSQILSTATHEMRHQFQHGAVENPNLFSDIPEEVLVSWEYELTPGNYIDPDYDYEGYYGQAIECDARDFTENVLESYLEIMKLKVGNV